MRTARTATGTPPAVTPSYACAHRMAQMHDRTVVTLLRPRTSRKPHGIVCCGGALATLLFELDGCHSPTNTTVRNERLAQLRWADLEPGADRQTRLALR